MDGFFSRFDESFECPAIRTLPTVIVEPENCSVQRLSRIKDFIGGVLQEIILQPSPSPSMGNYRDNISKTFSQRYVFQMCERW